MKVVNSTNELYDGFTQKNPVLIPWCNADRLLFVEGEDDYRLQQPLDNHESLKMRISGVKFDEKNLQLAIGRVGYDHILADRQSYFRENGDAVAIELERGRREGAPFAYIASAIGVAAIVETMDSFFVLGERSDAALHQCGSLLHGIAGYCEQGEDFHNIDPVGDIYRELEEETGIGGDSVLDTKLLGLCFHELKVGVNFIFHFRIDRPASYFMNNGPWRNAKDGDEHSSFLVCTPQEFAAVIENKNVHYSIKGIATALK